MVFPPKEVLDDIKKFDALPSTPEKEAISKRFLSDEIGNLEFYSQTQAYIRSINA